ncbi:MAG: PKD domain-containing protein [Bacteroidia bacterium]
MRSTLLTFLFLAVTITVVAQPGTSWQLTGPSLFPTNASGQVNGIGRVCQLKFHPTDPQKMYAVSASGGLWISSDSSHTWTKTGTDNLPATPCASVCVDYTDDNILYLGTGDPNYYGGSFGIWKSTDGGVTWNQSTSGLGNLLPVEILMDPSDHNTLVTATENGIFKSTDAGASWVNVKTGGDFKDMQFQPGSSTVLYAVNSSEFWRSIDFGSTWTQITSGVAVPGGGSGNGMRIAVSPAAPAVVYVGMITDNGTILKSTDAGLNFTTIYHSFSQTLVGYDSADIGGGQGNYNFSMTADPNDANIVYVVAHIVWRSLDGGLSWTHLTDWWGQLHTDMHGIRFHPVYTNKLFNVNDGGVWLSQDGGDNWIPRSDGIGATEVYHASQSPIKRDMVSIGTQDNGELYYAASEWKTNRGGDWGSRSAFDYITDNEVYYYENGNRRPVNGSETSYNLPFTPTNDIVLEFPKKLPNATFSGEMNVWRSVNVNTSSPSWTQISTFNQQVMAMNSSPADSTMLYVVTASNKIYRSDNALSASPTFSAYSTPVSSALYASIAGIKSNPNIVYMSCGSKIYRSTNKGATWSNVTSNLPIGVNIIKIYHDEFSTNEAMYVGTAKGIFYKDIGSTLWTNISYNLPTVADIQDFMFYNPGTAASLLRVAYYGRGVWELPINTSFPPAPDFTANVTTICPGQTVSFTDLSIGGPTSWSWSFPGGTPSSSALQNPTVTYPASGTYNVTLTVSNINGSDSHTSTSYITVTTAQPIPFSEGFASSVTPPNWTNYDALSNGIVWQQSTAAGGFGSSSESAFFDNYDYDVSGQYDELRTPQYDFTSSSHPVMTFDRAYARWSGSYYDSLAVLASTDCGVTFNLLYIKGYSALATAPDNSSSMFVPLSTEWKKDTVDLISYAGQNNVMIAFQNRGHYGQALYIDNINLTTSVGINNLQNASPISVYPNPSTGIVNISGLKEGNDIEVFDMTGRSIYKGKAGNKTEQLNITDLARGIYFFKVTDGVKLLKSGKISLD